MNASFYSGKIAVVTGAGGTLCSVIAQRLAADGASVALLGRTAASLEKVAAAIRTAGGTALPLACDVMDVGSVARAREIVVRESGVPWILVNNAGGNQAEAITSCTEFDPAELKADRPAELRGFFNLSPAKIGDVIATNTLGTMIPCQVFGRNMAAAQRGSILTFGSMTSYRPISRVAAYATAKTGIVCFTQ